MRIIVVGCGRVGEGLARELAMGRHAVTVIDIDASAFERLPPGFTGKTLVGVGFDRSVLLEAGIEHADAVAAVAGDDAVNAVVARLAAVRFRVPRVVARMYDPRQADLYRRLGSLTISPVEWGIRRLADLIVAGETSGVVSLGGGQVDLTQFSVPPMLDGHPYRELERPGEARVVAVTRGGRTFIPDGAAPMRRGDVAYVATAGGAGRVEDLVGEA